MTLMKIGKNTGRALAVAAAISLITAGGAYARGGGGHGGGFGGGFRGGGFGRFGGSVIIVGPGNGYGYGY